MLLLFGVACLTLSASRRELWMKLSAAALLLGALATCGFVPFVVGIFRATAAYWLGREFFNDRTAWHFVSLALNYHGRGIFNVILFSLGATGALWLALRGRSVARAFAITLLTAVGLLFCFGAPTVLVNFWHGPSPLYFEFFLWPFYVAYAAEAVRTCLKEGADLATRHWPWVSRAANLFLKLVRPGPPYYITLSVLPWFILAVAFLVSQAKERNYTYPPATTPVVDYLRREVGLVPGGEFRGRVATLTGQTFQRPISWFDLHAMDYRLMDVSGNDHRTAGLWYFNIPTVFEYSPLISPGSYLVTREFLSRVDDLQMRSVLTIRNFAPGILRLLGVRFAITDAPIAPDALLRKRQVIKGFGELFLYELERPNLGDFSPTKTVLAPDARAILAALSSAGFDPEREVVVARSLHGTLVPATAASLYVEIDRLHLQAASDGTSVLVLPLEFSHCLLVEGADGEQASRPRLFRANLMQTGVIFGGRLNVWLRYFAGPLRNSGCRLADAREMESLDVTALRRPAYGHR